MIQNEATVEAIPSQIESRDLAPGSQERQLARHTGLDHQGPWGAQTAARVRQVYTRGCIQFDGDSMCVLICSAAQNAGTASASKSHNEI